ncbi:hypothetical protein P9735_16730, partial [Bacillus safensis]|nr:hypothetical protein [Bacillus safensis]
MLTNVKFAPLRCSSFLGLQRFSITLKRRQLTPKQLRETVEKVLGSDTYRAGIEKIEESFQAAGGTEK